MPYSVHLKKTQLGRNVVYEFYQHLFGNPETITLLIITTYTSATLRKDIFKVTTRMIVSGEMMPVAYLTCSAGIVLIFNRET